MYYQTPILLFGQGGVSYDADAQAFFTSAGITDTTQKSAVNQLVLDLKGYSIWTLLKAIYPFVGGTATTHKYNLKDPRDLDAAFRGTFTGGWTHAPTGATPNGSTGYLDTHFNPNTDASVNGFSFGFYSRTNSVSSTQVYGNFDGVASTCQNNLSNGNFISGAISNAINYTASPTTRMLMSRRSSSTSHQAYRDGTSLGTSTVAESSLVPNNFYFGARNSNGTANLFMTHEHAFAFLGLGLTNQNALDLTTAINTFQTTLGRNV